MAPYLYNNSDMLKDSSEQLSESLNSKFTNQDENEAAQEYGIADKIAQQNQVSSHYQKSKIDSASASKHDPANVSGMFDGFSESVIPDNLSQDPDLMEDHYMMNQIASEWPNLSYRRMHAREFRSRH